jgi:hypothetical protein
MEGSLGDKTAELALHRSPSTPPHTEILREAIEYFSVLVNGLNEEEKRGSDGRIDDELNDDEGSVARST